MNIEEFFKTTSKVMFEKPLYSYTELDGVYGNIWDTETSLRFNIYQQGSSVFICQSLPTQARIQMSLFLPKTKIAEIEDGFITPKYNMLTLARKAVKNAQL